jgi:hypothetical protein
MPPKYDLDFTKSFSEPPGKPKSPASALILGTPAPADDVRSPPLRGGPAYHLHIGS